MTFVWVIIGSVVLLALLSGGSKGKQSGPVRIDHPHVIDDDETVRCGCAGFFVLELLKNGWKASKIKGKPRTTLEE